MGLATKVKATFAGVVIFSIAAVVMNSGVLSGPLAEGPGGIANPQPAARTHKVSSQLKTRPGAKITLYVGWGDQKPWIIWPTVDGQGPAINDKQIAGRPKHWSVTYPYDPLHDYAIEASQYDPNDQGPLDCEIAIDEKHIDGDRISRGAGTVHCWTEHG